MNDGELGAEPEFVDCEQVCDSVSDHLHVQPENLRDVVIRRADGDEVDDVGVGGLDESEVVQKEARHHPDTTERLVVLEPLGGGGDPLQSDGQVLHVSRQIHRSIESAGKSSRSSAHRKFVTDEDEGRHERQGRNDMSFDEPTDVEPIGWQQDQVCRLGEQSFDKVDTGRSDREYIEIGASNEE